MTKVFTRDINLEHQRVKDYVTTERQTTKDFGRVTFSEFDGAKYGLC